MEITQATLTIESIQHIATLAIIGFGVALLITPIYTTLAYKYRWWKQPRTATITGEDAVQFLKLHKEKHRRNIPTMAGIIFLISIAAVTLLLNFRPNYIFTQTVLPLVAILGAGAVGLLDDLINLKGSKGVAGLHSRVKLALITLVALLGGFYFVFKLGYNSLYVPVLDQTLLIGGFGVLALFVLVVIATANAVNISDGLDGLAGGLLSSAFSAYVVIALLQDKIGIAGFCATVAGALFAYTWFNIYPARFFMGDVGSFALGAALGVIAMLTDTVFLLPIIGGVFVVEAGSSLLQILSKRYRGKKLFIAAPIHHHFEAKGWPETKVTMRFWILGQVLAVIGVTLALIGGVK